MGSFEESLDAARGSYTTRVDQIRADALDIEAAQAFRQERLNALAPFILDTLRADARAASSRLASLRPDAVISTFSDPKDHHPVQTTGLWVVKAIQPGFTPNNERPAFGPGFRVLGIDSTGEVRVYPVKTGGIVTTMSAGICKYRTKNTRYKPGQIETASDTELLSKLSFDPTIDDIEHQPHVKDWRQRILNIFEQGENRELV